MAIIIATSSLMTYYKMPHCGILSSALQNIIDLEVNKFWKNIEPLWEEDDNRDVKHLGVILR